MDWVIVVRWIHVMAAAIWLGQVVVINLILVPTARGLSSEDRTRFLGDVFPRVFRLASVLSLTALASGLTMLLQKYGVSWSVFSALTATGMGTALLIGAILAVTLTLFHFLVEPRVEDLICVAQDNPDSGVDEQIVGILRIVPKAGLGVIVAIFLLMMISVRWV